MGAGGRPAWLLRRLTGRAFGGQNGSNRNNPGDLEDRFLGLFSNRLEGLTLVGPNFDCESDIAIADDEAGHETEAHEIAITSRCFDGAEGVSDLVFAKLGHP